MFNKTESIAPSSNRVVIVVRPRTRFFESSWAVRKSSAHHTGRRCPSKLEHAHPRTGGQVPKHTQINTILLSVEQQSHRRLFFVGGSYLGDRGWRHVDYDLVDERYRDLSWIIASSRLLQ